MGSGVKLKNILRDKKMTIKQLAEMADISVNTLYSITKRDTEKIDTAILERICNALNISEDDFYGIPPLPEVQLPIEHGSSIMVPYSPQDQELDAFRDYMQAMGYYFVLEPATFGKENPDNLWSLYDSRTHKKYFVNTDLLDKLMLSVNSFLKFQVSDTLSSLNDVPWE